MKLITRKARAQAAPATWAKVHHNKPADSREGRIRERLLALDPATITADEVDAITEGTGMTRVPHCGECERGQYGDPSLEAVVEIGEDPYYESATAWVCPECLKVALDLCAEET